MELVNLTQKLTMKEFVIHTKIFTIPLMDTVKQVDRFLRNSHGSNPNWF